MPPEGVHPLNGGGRGSYPNYFENAREWRFAGERASVNCFSDPAAESEPGRSSCPGSLQAAGALQRMFEISELRRAAAFSAESQ